MHTLETLHRLNADALTRSIKHFTDQGRFVVVTYYGLQVGSVETFSDEAAAFTALNAPMASPDMNRKLVPPTPRPPSNAGVTLASYVNQIQSDNLESSHTA